MENICKDGKEETPTKKLVNTTPILQIITVTAAGYYLKRAKLRNYAHEQGHQNLLRKQGEGDLTLDYWYEEHAFFKKELFYPTVYPGMCC